MANANPDCDGMLTGGVRHVANASALIALGAEFGRRLRAGRAIGLDGPLGAGKTHFVKGLALGLGSDAEVSSPTFTLVHEYPARGIGLVHFDFYRLESAHDVAALGWDDYFDGGSVIAVEWASRFPDCMPADALWVHIAIADDGGRIVRWEAAP